MSKPCDCPICRLGEQLPPASANVPKSVLDLKATLEKTFGDAVSVRVVNVDELLGEKPAPVTPEPKAELEQWGIFIDHGDGNGFYEDKGPRLPTKEDAEARARFTESSCRLFGVPVPKWEVRRVLAPAQEIAMLRARVATLVQSEARAVAGEKAASDALARARETIAELAKRYAAKLEAEAPTEPPAGVVDHGPNGVGC